MLSVTFLGHQGWLFVAGHTSVLVDPLLTETVGHNDSVGAVFPVRRFAFESFPSIDAVLFTHEHEDHFDIPSILRLDRRIPAFVSSRSSIAARSFLKELGFRVDSFSPEQPLVVGGLEFIFLAANHLGESTCDEWDVLPFVVKDRQHGGSFTTTVDLPASPEFIRSARAVLDRPGVWCLTSNVLDLSTQVAGLTSLSVAERAGSFVRRHICHHDELSQSWAEPVATVVAGTGFHFTGDRSWLNAQAFPLDPSSLTRALQAARPDRRFIELKPGLTLCMREGDGLDVVPSKFLAAAQEQPSRVYQPQIDLLQDYAPATGRRRLETGELLAVEERLQSLARFLYGTQLFSMLYSLGNCAPYRPNTFALVLLTGDDDYSVYEYAPQECDFLRAHSDDPASNYLAGLECWASDLLAVLQSRMTPSALVLGRSRTWNNRADVRLPILETLLKFAHPLRHPKGYLRFYREMAHMTHADVLVQAVDSMERLDV